MKSTKNLPSIPTLLKGAKAFDDRGSVGFINDFDFNSVKRMYQVENHDTTIIRAFHGHQHEAKYVYVTAGTALVCAVKMTDKVKPSTSEPVQRFVLTANQPSILFIPAGYANGFKAFSPDTKIIFFSTSTVEESKADDYRFPYDYWGTQIWETEYR